MKLSIYVDGLKSAFLSESEDLGKIVIENNNKTGNQNNLLVFPNPANKGVLYINLGSDNESATINIVDLNGRAIFNKTFVNYSSTEQLDISELKKGIYLVYIRQGNVIYHSKLIVE